MIFFAESGQSHSFVSSFECDVCEVESLVFVVQNPRFVFDKFGRRRRQKNAGFFIAPDNSGRLLRSAVRHLAFGFGFGDFNAATVAGAY